MVALAPSCAAVVRLLQYASPFGVERNAALTIASTRLVRDRRLRPVPGAQLARPSSSTGRATHTPSRASPGSALDRLAGRTVGRQQQAPTSAAAVDSLRGDNTSLAPDRSMTSVTDQAPASYA